MASVLLLALSLFLAAAPARAEEIRFQFFIALTFGGTNVPLTLVASMTPIADVVRIGVALFNVSPDPLTSDALPIDLPFDGFSSRTFDIVGCQGVNPGGPTCSSESPDWRIEGDLTAVTVPEPSTPLLGLAALAALGATARARLSGRSPSRWSGAASPEVGRSGSRSRGLARRLEERGPPRGR